MFNKFKQLSELKKMRDRAMQVKKELAQEKVEMEKGGVKVVVRGDQRIEKIEMNGEINQELADILNKALDEAQKKAARKMMAGGGLSSLLN